MKITFNFHESDKEPPKESGEYLCCFSNGTVMTVRYYEKFKAFNVCDEESLCNQLFPLYWAEIPKKLKKEQENKWRNENETI